MYCYGDNERTFPWFPRTVPSENFPALELDGRVMSESDDLIIACEQIYGSMGGAGAPGMHHPRVIAIRNLERKIFSAWCAWLCRAAPDARTEAAVAARFDAVAAEVDAALAHKLSSLSSSSSGAKSAGAQIAVGPFFLGATAPTAADAIFAPYLERMNASLFYYKGYRMRHRFANIDRWFRALEQRPSYRGMRSDFHTHCHDLPPQMGACVPNGTAEQKAMSAWVDFGPWFDVAKRADDGSTIVQRLRPAFATPDPEFPAPVALSSAASAGDNDAPASAGASASSAASLAADASPAAAAALSPLALPTRHAALTEAITRTWLHAPTLVAINGADGDRQRIDAALRCALTRMAAAARRAAATNEAVDDPLLDDDDESDEVRTVLDFFCLDSFAHEIPCACI